MSKLLDIKRFVSSQTSKADWAVPEAKRDTIINQARREFYSNRRWQFLKKVSDISFVSGKAGFPVDYNPSFDIGQLYFYIDKDKTRFSQVEIEDIEGYAENDSPVFALDIENSEILTNKGNMSVKISYCFLPADRALDGSEDNEVEPANNISAIALLATAMWWLAKERDNENYKTFYVRYQEALRKETQRDNIFGPVNELKRFIDSFNLGFNE